MLGCERFVKILLLMSLLPMTVRRNAYGMMENLKDFIVKDIESLSALPMSQLIRIQRNVELMMCHRNETRKDEQNGETILMDDDPERKEQRNVDFEINGAENSPLISTNSRRSNSWQDPWNQKPTKVQKFFQLSITALSFLAFGGYLLCMIVQAIKSKGTTYFHPSINPTASGINGGILKKVKIYRTKRNARIKRNFTYDNDNGEQANPSPDELYKILTTAAEGYVQLSTFSQ